MVSVVYMPTTTIWPAATSSLCKLCPALKPECQLSPAAAHFHASAQKWLLPSAVRLRSVVELLPDRSTLALALVFENWDKMVPDVETPQNELLREPILKTVFVFLPLSCSTISSDLFLSVKIVFAQALYLCFSLLYEFYAFTSYLESGDFFLQPLFYNEKCAKNQLFNPWS